MYSGLKEYIKWYLFALSENEVKCKKRRTISNEFIDYNLASIN